MTTPVTPVADAALPLPDPADLGTWGARMAEMHRWMREDLRTGMNALGEDTYTNALAASSVANFVGAWSSLTGPLAIPASVSHGGKLWFLLASVADVTAETPGVSASWQDVTPLAAADVVIVTGATGSAKIPTGTTAQRDGSPSQGWTRFNSTIARNETWNGTEWVPEGISGSVTVSLTGTAVDLTGIPAFARRITCLLNGFSFTGSNSLVVQIGTASGIETTSYAASTGVFGSTNIAVSLGSTSGFPVYTASGANQCPGVLVIESVDGSNTWLAHGNHTYGSTGWCGVTAGKKTLSGQLDRIRFTGNGGENFDAGSVTVRWEA